MPKVTKKQAYKAKPAHGIEIGDWYYEWKIRVGRSGRRCISKNWPLPSQLTASEFKGKLLRLKERFMSCEDGRGIKCIALNAVELIHELRDEQASKPQDRRSLNRELYRERIELCDRLTSELKALLEMEKSLDWTVSDGSCEARMLEMAKQVADKVRF